MAGFNDTEARDKAFALCDKRNKAILKTHHMRWKPLFDHGKGWHAALRPVGEGVKANVEA